MWRGVLDQLGELGNLLPRYTQPRCLLDRHAVGGCDRCQTSCPHEAVEVVPGGYAVDIVPDRCTGCGLCVQACPTGALEYDLQTPIQAIESQSKAAEATLTCAQSGAGGPNLPCLARVTPAQISTAGALNVPLTLIHGACDSCPVGSGEVPERLEQVAHAAMELRRATGQLGQVTIRPATPDDQEREVRISRRGAFGQLFRLGSTQVARHLPERPLPFVDWSEENQRTPEEWKWRRETLKPQPPVDVGIHWLAPIVDDTCIDCPVCANVCPTSAIERELQPDGGVKLLLNLSACTGCMACLRSCPPQAIHEQQEWLPAAFGPPLLLRESDSVM